jgi:hypothetical protein
MPENPGTPTLKESKMNEPTTTIEIFSRDRYFPTRINIKYAKKEKGNWIVTWDFLITSTPGDKLYYCKCSMSRPTRDTARWQAQNIKQLVKDEEKQFNARRLSEMREDPDSSLCAN